MILNLQQVTVIFLFVVLLLQILNSLNKKAIISKSQKKFNDFSNEISFLFYLIDTEVGNEFKFIIQPRLAQKQKSINLLNTKEINKNIDNVFNRINNYISDEYKQEIYKFINKDSFDSYLKDTIMTRIMSKSIDVNSNILFNMENAN